MILTLLEKRLQSILPDEDYAAIVYDVNKDSGCWEVTNRAKNKDGYPVARIKGSLDTLYRHFYRRYKGPIDAGVLIRHTCDNRLCCNPEHLIPGTPKQNVADMLERDRFPRGMNHGRAILDDGKIIDIRKRYDNKERISDIANQYGVDRKTIYKVVTGQTWKNVE